MCVVSDTDEVLTDLFTKLLDVSRSWTTDQSHPKIQNGDVIPLSMSTALHFMQFHPIFRYVILETPCFMLDYFMLIFSIKTSSLVSKERSSQMTDAQFLHFSCIEFNESLWEILFFLKNDELFPSEMKSSNILSVLVLSHASREWVFRSIHQVSRLLA